MHLFERRYSRKPSLLRASSFSPDLYLRSQQEFSRVPRVSRQKRETRLFDKATVSLFLPSGVQYENKRPKL
jgi:hypothetical protein